MQITFKSARAAFRLSAFVAFALVTWCWDLISAIHRERSARNTHLVFLPRSNPFGGSHRFRKLLIKKPTDKIVVPKAFSAAYIAFGSQYHLRDISLAIHIHLSSSNPYLLEYCVYKTLNMCAIYVHFYVII